MRLFQFIHGKVSVNCSQFGSPLSSLQRTGYTQGRQSVRQLDGLQRLCGSAHLTGLAPTDITFGNKNSGHEAMSQPRRHHIVPQMILRNFTNECGNLWCFSKNTRTCYEVSPSNIFVERDLYSAVLEDDSKDALAEMKMAEGVEAETAPLVYRLIHCAREGGGLDISCEEKKTLATFFHIQNARTRISYNILRNDKLFDSVIRQWEASGNSLTVEQRRMLDDEDSRGRFKKKMWLRYLIEGYRSDEETIPKLICKEIGVMFIQKPNKSFIIGDHPVIRRINERESSRLEDLGVLEILPVSHDVLLFWGREYYGDQERIIVHENEVIRSINEAILRQCTTIAGRSRDLVRSLSRSRAAQERPPGWNYTTDKFLSELEEMLLP